MNSAGTSEFQQKLARFDRERVILAFALSALVLITALGSMRGFVWLGGHLTRAGSLSADPPLRARTNLLVVVCYWLAVGALLTVSSRALTTRFRKRFKSQLLVPAVRLAFPEVRYCPGLGVSPQEFYTSNLFDKDKESLQSEDLIVIKREGTLACAMCEVVVSDIGWLAESRFCGPFALIPLGETFQGPVVINPLKMEAPGSRRESEMGQDCIAGWIPIGETGSEFASSHIAYAPRDRMPGKWFNEDFRQALLDVSRTALMPVRFSVIDGWLFIAVDFRVRRIRWLDRDFFDPPIFTALTPEYFSRDLDLVKAVAGIPERLGIQQEIALASQTGERLANLLDLIARLEK